MMTVPGADDCDLLVGDGGDATWVITRAWSTRRSLPRSTVSLSFAAMSTAERGTTTGRLIFELGGLPERELEKLKAEAWRLGMGSFAFAFYMGRQKEERERGVTISCATKEFYTEKWHYTITDPPWALRLHHEHDHRRLPG